MGKEHLRNIYEGTGKISNDNLIKKIGRRMNRHFLDDDIEIIIDNEKWSSSIITRKPWIKIILRLHLTPVCSPIVKLGTASSG